MSKIEHRISFSEVDSNLDLNIESAVKINQDFVSNYFYDNKIDNYSLKKKYNNIMVITRNYISFFKKVKWNELILADVYTCLKSKYRMVVESIMKDEDNQDVLVSKSEICMINFDTRDVMDFSIIDIETKNSLYNLKNHNLHIDKSNLNWIYDLIVMPTDIDFSNHVNNAIYVRYALNSLDFNFLSNINIKSLEIHYIKEALLNDKLSIYNKIDDNIVTFIIYRDDEELIRARIEYEK